jgi:seryl-tRNA synthetase
VYPRFEHEHVPPVRTLLIHGQCYRHEASAEPGRLRSFRMTELVRIGEPEDCDGWRLAWRDRVADWLTALGLDVLAEPATDPFFGPADRLMRSSQLEQELKWELRVPVADGLRQAIASTNYHQDHFGSTFDLSAEDGPAHSACVAFGLDRIALALSHVHGPDLSDWPERVRHNLTQ